MAIRRDDFPLPDVDDPLTAPFFAGAARGELVITRCDACDAYVWYPQAQCPHVRRRARRGSPVSGARHVVLVGGRAARVPARVRRHGAVRDRARRARRGSGRAAPHLPRRRRSRDARADAARRGRRSARSQFSTVPGKSVIVPMFRPVRPGDLRRPACRRPARPGSRARTAPSCSPTSAPTSCSRTRSTIRCSPTLRTSQRHAADAAPWLRRRRPRDRERAGSRAGGQRPARDRVDHRGRPRRARRRARCSPKRCSRRAAAASPTTGTRTCRRSPSAGNLGEYVTGAFAALGAATAWWPGVAHRHRRDRRRLDARSDADDVRDGADADGAVPRRPARARSRWVMIPGNEPTGDGRYVGITTVTTQQWQALARVHRPRRHGRRPTSSARCSGDSCAPTR